jgi:formate hydrogenlyase subunit 3/multisubunit Na+/H+ antiporter MnhD subunit
MMGLSITVHLLNLLTIPSIVMLYYFRRYDYKRWGGILALLLSFALTGMVLWVFIYLIPRWSAGFDRIFVNDLNLPFFSGFSVFFILLAILCWVGLRWAERKGKSMLRLCIWCFQRQSFH